MTNWLDIKSAPKDGQQILATDGEIVTAIEWDGEDWVDYCLYDSAAFPFMPFTHWQPLPSPPKN